MRRRSFSFCVRSRRFWSRSLACARRSWSAYAKRLLAGHRQQWKEEQSTYLPTNIFLEIILAANGGGELLESCCFVSVFKSINGLTCSLRWNSSCLASSRLGRRLLHSCWCECSCSSRRLVTHYAPLARRDTASGSARSVGTLHFAALSSPHRE